MAFAIKEVVSGLFEPIRALASEFIIDKDKRAELNSSLAEAQIGLQHAFVEVEKELITAKGKVIVAEANSQSWITSNWRPLTMLTFVFLVVSKWFGLTDANIDVQLEVELMQMIKIGLGGYVVGRSAEKIVPKVAAILKQK